MSIQNPWEKSQPYRTKVYTSMQNIMANLWARYQDEGRYEDWKEYEAKLREIFEQSQPELKFIKATRRPFGITYEIPELNMTINLSCKANRGYLTYTSEILSH